jgi:hypothetical protein
MQWLVWLGILQKFFGLVFCFGLLLPLYVYHVFMPCFFVFLARACRAGVSLPFSSLAPSLFSLQRIDTRLGVWCSDGV